MNHADHVELIRAGIARIPAGCGRIWAPAPGPSRSRCAIWRARRCRSGRSTGMPGALKRQKAAFEKQFPGTGVHFITGDIERPRELPPLDGIVAANSIHYIRDQVSLLRRWKTLLKPGGRIIVVEYDTDRGNTWVPYPLSLGALDKLARSAGFSR